MSASESISSSTTTGFSSPTESSVSRTSAPAIATESATGSSDKGRSSGTIGGIIGGVAGGVALVILAVLFYFRCKRQSNFFSSDDIGPSPEVSEVHGIESPGGVPGGRLGTGDPPGTIRLNHPEGFDTELGGRLGTGQ